MKTPRRIPIHTIDSPKLPLLSTKMLLQILVARFTHENMRERGRGEEKFWYSRLAMRIDKKMRKRGSNL
jgi:hypothetical protein